MRRRRQALAHERVHERVPHAPDDVVAHGHEHFELGRRAQAGAAGRKDHVRRRLLSRISLRPAGGGAFRVSARAAAWQFFPWRPRSNLKGWRGVRVGRIGPGRLLPQRRRVAGRALAPGLA